MILHSCVYFLSHCLFVSTTGWIWDSRGYTVPRTLGSPVGLKSACQADCTCTRARVRSVPQEWSGPYLSIIAISSLLFVCQRSLQPCQEKPPLEERNWQSALSRSLTSENGIIWWDGTMFCELKPRPQKRKWCLGYFEAKLSLVGLFRHDAQFGNSIWPITSPIAMPLWYALKSLWFWDTAKVLTTTTVWVANLGPFGSWSAGCPIIPWCRHQSWNGTKDVLPLVVIQN